MTDENQIPAPATEFLLYQEDSGDFRVQVRLQDGAAWLTQRDMADLYQSSVPNINQHISAIYEESELAPQATIKKYLIVQTEGSRTVRRLVDHYSLEMVLAVGYRVRSPRGVEFRRWATSRLREYLVKGFTMDDERLKGKAGVADYFDELLERIREIRASEARVYLMVRNIFALAADYREGEQDTLRFFAIMQNKMHYAATGLTAAEIIKQRADAAQPNMGLTSWKGSRVLKGDVGTAKNYLSKEEIDTLNRITVMFLDQAEFRAQRRQGIRMADWEDFLDKFLADVELPVLDNAGRVSHEAARTFTAEQYDQFTDERRRQAQAEADVRYIDDLKNTAAMLKQQRNGEKGR